MGTFKAGIMGAGGIAALLHLPEIEGVEGLEVINIADRMESRLKLLCKKFDIPKYVMSWEELLADDEVEGVVVALPHPLHAQAGKLVLEAGKHLFMQKPLCATMQEADMLVAECESRPELTVFCRPSYGSVTYTMRKMIADGAVGKISSAACRHSHGGPEVYYAEVVDFFGEEQPKDSLWFFDPKRASVGALFDMGVYAVSGLVGLLGKAVSVTARLSTVDKPTTLEDTATLIIEFENGALGTAETGWCDPARTSFTRVHGTKGKLWNPGNEGNPLDYIIPSSAVDENAPLITEPAEMLPGENQHAEWLRHIQAGTQPEISNIWCARHITEILLGALESSKTKKQVELKTSPYKE